MIPVLYSVALLVGVALICGIVLTVTSRLFSIKEDDKAAAVRSCLPGANCGACGYAGCDGYAKALSDGTAAGNNLCIPGGDSTAQDIAEILGVKADDVIEQIAFVACNGVCGAVERKYDYNGPKSCSAASLSYKGDKACTWACLGYGDCSRVCPNDAITVVDNVARIAPEKCIGCGICVRTCPQSIIRLIDDSSKVAVKCSNHEKGAITRKSCSNGCIGCMKCEKICPHGAIQVENNLATIDYSLCTGCGRCAEVCPVKCIHYGDFTGNAHL
jgi:Na+-translocating ferredoxin:NAD+ oxidoreductase RNF subunit RnfB